MNHFDIIALSLMDSDLSLVKLNRS